MSNALIHVPSCAKHLHRIHDWPRFCSATERFHMTLPGPPYWYSKTMLKTSPAFLLKNVLVIPVNFRNHFKTVVQNNLTWSHLVIQFVLCALKE